MKNLNRLAVRIALYLFAIRFNSLIKSIRNRLKILLVIAEVRRPIDTVTEIRKSAYGDFIFGKFILVFCWNAPRRVVARLIHNLGNLCAIGVTLRFTEIPETESTPVLFVRVRRTLRPTRVRRLVAGFTVVLPKKRKRGIMLNDCRPFSVLKLILKHIPADLIHIEIDFENLLLALLRKAERNFARFKRLEIIVENFPSDRTLDVIVRSDNFYTRLGLLVIVENIAALRFDDIHLIRRGSKCTAEYLNRRADLVLILSADKFKIEVIT